MYNKWQSWKMCWFEEVGAWKLICYCWFQNRREEQRRERGSLGLVCWVSTVLRTELLYWTGPKCWEYPDPKMRRISSPDLWADKYLLPQQPLHPLLQCCLDHELHWFCWNSKFGCLLWCHLLERKEILVVEPGWSLRMSSLVFNSSSMIFSYR